MASYEEFEQWHGARNGADPSPDVDFGVKLLMGGDPLPPLPELEKSEGLI
jgi:hypothetical protein